MRAHHRVAVAVAALLLVASVAAQVDLPAEVFEIAAKLRCPVCISESVAQSSSPTAEEMRRIIAQRLEAGANEAEILAYFQRRYGDWILLEPPRRGIYLLAWGLPIGVGVATLAGLALLVRRWVRSSRTPIDVDPAYLARVRESASEGRAE